MRIKKILLIMALTAAITAPLCAQQQAKGQRTLQYVVGKGDTISSIAQKILTPPQRKKLLESLASRKETLPLQVQDTMLFTFNADAQLLALDYSTKKPAAASAGVPRVPATALHPPSGTRTVEGRRVFVVASGDNVIEMARRAQLPTGVIRSLHQHAQKLRFIKPRDEVTVSWADAGVLQGVSLRRGKLSSTLVGVGYKQHGGKADAVPQQQSMYAADSNHRLVPLRIKHEFVKDASAAGVPQPVIASLQNIYAKNKYAASMLRPGSHIDIIYAPRSKDPVVYARLSRGNKKYEAIRFHNRNGVVAYYDSQGKPYQQESLRMPIASPRISSHFSLGRRHPILGRVRPHYGIDLAARTGTPVWASAPGKIHFMGFKKGYGRVIEVQHSPSVKTLYAHLSRFDKNIKTGTAVTQQQVIGYVGSSGVSTGPHLHYEYHINNQPRDPMTVALARNVQLLGSDRTLLLASRQRWLAMATTTPSA